MKSKHLSPIRLSDLTSGLLQNARNLFGSSAKEEERETRELYEEVRALHEASILADEDAASQFMFDIVNEAFTQVERKVNLPLAEALFETIRQIVEMDGLLFWFPDVNEFSGLDPHYSVALRAYLRRKQYFLSDQERLTDVWREKVIRLFADILSYVPQDAFPPDSDGDGDHDDLTFHAALVDRIDNPAEVIERLVITFFDEDILYTKLFTPMQEQIEANALIASGITPDMVERTTRSVTWPTEMKGRSPHELVGLYLHNTPFAEFFESEMPFVIPINARFEHCHIVAGTGHGKTQTLQTQIYEDIQRAARGECSVVVIDSQGDLIRTISHLAEFSPKHPQNLADKLLLIDPNDVEYPVCLNMFDMNKERIADYAPVDREKILNGAIELYEYIFGALLGAELTQKQSVIFRYLARLMLVIPNATVQTLVALMEDGTPFKPYIEQLSGTSRKFFETQFFHKSFVATKTQILRRLWGVLSNTSFERMFSHVENKVDIFGAMNDGKIILIDTAKDLLKREGSEIFGRFFISMIAQAALERATIPAEKRMPTFVYVDEAHEYFDETVELLLGQARKYKIGFTIAHQTLDQANAGLRASMMANTSIKFVGGVSNKDAKAFAAEMRCEADFVQSTRKRKTETEFACFVRHITEHAIKISIPQDIVLDQHKGIIHEPHQPVTGIQRPLQFGGFANTDCPSLLIVQKYRKIETYVVRVILDVGQVVERACIIDCRQLSHEFAASRGINPPAVSVVFRYVMQFPIIRKPLKYIPGRS